MKKQKKQKKEQKKNLKFKSRQILIPVVFFLSVADLVFSSEDMVQVSVEIAEINNDRARELGIEWQDELSFGEISYSQQGRLPEYLPEVPSVLRIGEISRYSIFFTKLKFLQENGAAKIISKPRLVTKSGSSAKFLVGGEMPVIVSGISGGTVEWKEFGIKVEIKPLVLTNKEIDVSIKAEISRIDWNNMVYNYPVISTREAESFVKVKSGETITIAGLNETKKEEKKKGIPLLSDIPLIGILFGKKMLIDINSTIVVFVTPSLID
ncbi:MAG: hypothetical protein ACK4JE_03810 [Endomicrobiia bacterium]